MCVIRYQNPQIPPYFTTDERTDDLTFVELHLVLWTVSVTLYLSCLKEDLPLLFLLPLFLHLLQLLKELELRPNLSALLRIVVLLPTDGGVTVLPQKGADDYKKVQTETLSGCSVGAVL